MAYDPIVTVEHNQSAVKKYNTTMTWPNQSQRSLACLRVDAMAVPRPQGSCFQLNGWGAAKRMKEVAPLLPTRGTSRAHVTRKLSHPASSAQRPHTHRHKESLSLPGSRSLPRRTRPRRLHSDGTQPLPRVRPTQARGVGQCENVKKKKKKEHVRQTRNPRQRQSAREPLVQPGPNNEKTTSLFVSPITWAEAAWCGKTVRGSRAVR